MFRIALLTALLLVAPSSAAQIDRCVIEVGGTVYLDGPCNFEPADESGVTTVGVTDTAPRSPYFAYLFAVEDGSITAVWNGPEQDSHAGYELGAVTKHGECWTNENASICAYDGGI